jgi:ATP-dependent helicase/nuclease subunit B
MHAIARLRGGAGLPAQGDDAVCEHCEMRALCRRDYWGDD